MTAMRSLALAFALSLAAAQAAFAHGQQHSAAHAHHGGTALQIGSYEAELVAHGDEMTLFLRDRNEREIDASKLSASALVLAKGNERRRVALQPAGGNKLVGRLDFAIEGKLRAIVTLKDASGAELGMGRYSVDRH
jgi:hypothetical protein